MLILHDIILTMSVLQPKINRHTRKKKMTHSEGKIISTEANTR